MKITYDKEADAMYIEIREAEHGSTKEIGPGLILDFDPAGEITGIELLFVSERIPINELFKKTERYGTLLPEYPELYARFLRYEKEHFGKTYFSRVFSWLINPEEPHGLKERFGDLVFRQLGWPETLRKYEILFEAAGYNIPFDFLIKTREMNIFFELITDASTYDESNIIKKLYLVRDFLPEVKGISLALILPQRQMEDVMKIMAAIPESVYRFAIFWEGVAENLEVIVDDPNTQPAISHFYGISYTE